MRKSWRVKHHQKYLQAIRRSKKRIEQNNSLAELLKQVTKDLRYFEKHRVESVKMHRAYKLICRRVTMTKQELAHIARLMYDLQEECESRDYCPNCSASITENGYHKRCYFDENEPQLWGITKADIERLEREE